MSKRTKKPPYQESFTIVEFCVRHAISRSSYYQLRGDGIAPTEFRVGRAVRISRDAEGAWMEMMQAGDQPYSANDGEVEDAAPKKKKKADSSRSHRPACSDIRDNRRSKKTRREDQ